MGHIHRTLDMVIFRLGPKHGWVTHVWFYFWRIIVGDDRKTLSISDKYNLFWVWLNWFRVIFTLCIKSLVKRTFCPCFGVFRLLSASWNHWFCRLHSGSSINRAPPLVPSERSEAITLSSTPSFSSSRTHCWSWKKDFRRRGPSWWRIVQWENK